MTERGAGPRAPEGTAPAAEYDGHAAAGLARLLDLPRVLVLARTTSTLDVAHDLAARGASPGTLVLAERQTAGRGRSGRRWTSTPGGLWMTLIERPHDPAALAVLPLRLGLAAARVLERHSAEPVRLKWPNDLYVGLGKVGGILVEARWRDGRLDWACLGLGVNVGTPTDVPRAAGLAPGVSRVAVLTELVPALRAAARARGTLSEREVAAYADRDLARGRRCTAPAPGTVCGITATGELRIALGGEERTFRGGSLVLAEDA